MLRTLEGLAAVTGADRWRQAADNWIAHAMEKLRDPDSDLLYWGGHSCWDDGAGGFHPLLNDGTRLCANDVDDSGYCPPAKLATTPANGLLLLSYARAARILGDPGMRRMALRLAEVMGWGQLENGSLDIATATARLTGGPEDACSLQGLLELYLGDPTSGLLVVDGVSTRPPQVRVPMRGPISSRRKTQGKKSPPDPASSLISSTLGPRIPAGSRMGRPPGTSLVIAARRLRVIRSTM